MFTDRQNQIVQYNFPFKNHSNCTKSAFPSPRDVADAVKSNREKWKSNHLQTWRRSWYYINGLKSSVEGERMCAFLLSFFHFIESLLSLRVDWFYCHISFLDNSVRCSLRGTRAPHTYDFPAVRTFESCRYRCRGSCFVSLLLLSSLKRQSVGVSVRQSVRQAWNHGVQSCNCAGVHNRRSFFSFLSFLWNFSKFSSFFFDFLLLFCYFSYLRAPYASHIEKFSTLLVRVSRKLTPTANLLCL